MHISLDSALGQQRRLNQVGESITQIAPDPAAAYSLRSLTGADPKVVRVRRGSDNHEQDFTASEVSSGALTSFVNAQVVAPLDIQALSATGRDGDFLIAKAAYSLRSLGTRQATLSATGDTVARADGKYVCQVRRSSDDALKSFTATEITDGTLLAFVNEDVTIYQSDYSADANGWSGSTSSPTGNHDGVSDSAGTSKDNVLKLVKQADSQGYMQRDQGVVAGLTYTVSGSFFAPASNTAVDGIAVKDGVAGSSLSDYPSGYLVSDGTWTDFSFSYTATASGTQRVNFGISSLGSNPNGSSTGSSGDIVYIADLKFVETTSNGFVKTWYDQSVTTQAGDTATGNHAVQATAASQPKIVDAGSLISGGLRFDDAQSLETAGTFSFGDGTTLSTFLVNKSDKDQNAYLFRFSSNYIVYNTTGGGRKVFAGTNATAGTASDNEELWTTISTINSSGGTSNFFADGTLVSSADANIGTSIVSPARKLNIGGSASSNHWNGTVNEVIFYDTDQTNNRVAIDANIGEHYSLDLPSGVDPRENQVDGFVETWYDQSGNSKDAIQTTANLQPVIVAAGVFQNGLKFDSDGSSSGPDFRTPIDSAELSNDPSGNAGFALVWVGNVNQSQHDPTNDHSVLGNVKNVQTYSTGSIGLSVIPQTGTVKFTSETGGTTREVVEDTSALTPGDFGVIFFSYEDAEAGVDPLLSVDGSVTTSGLSALNSSSSNNIGIMTAITGGNAIQYSRSTDGICKEVLLYTGDQKSKRAALETNIAAEYGITLS